MKISLFKFLDSKWEDARGYLREDLEHLEEAINLWSGKTFGNGTTLSALAIQGDPTIVPQYVSNTGTPNNAPKWDLVDLIAGVKRRLQFVHLVAATTGSVLLGRRSGSAGDFEQLTLGPGLAITGTVIDVSGSTNRAQMLAIASLRA